MNSGWDNIELSPEQTKDLMDFGMFVLQPVIFPAYMVDTLACC